MHDSSQSILFRKNLLRSTLRRARAAQAQELADHAENYSRHMLHLVDHHMFGHKKDRGHRLTIAAFLPLATEPPILDGLKQLAEKHRIIVPLVQPQHRLDWVQWTPQCAFTTHRLGMVEPLGQHLGGQAFHTADLRFIPSLAFDTRGKRLGQGGGYYDRLLEGSNLNTAQDHRTFGVVFSREILDRIPAEKHDIRIYRVLTETGVIQLGP